jgi:hypothetical protein
MYPSCNAGLGLNISLHEIGRHWPYPVLSLLFSSGLCTVLYGLIWAVMQRSLKARPRNTASLHTRAPSKTRTTQTNIQATTAWKWEFPTDETNLVETQTASMPDLLSNEEAAFTDKPCINWAKHKHYIACGSLLAGGCVCSILTSPRMSYQWQIFVFEVLFYLFSIATTNAFQFTLPFTFFISEYIQKTNAWVRRGLLLVIFGGFVNGIPIVLDSSFNGWCGSMHYS